MLVLVVPAEPVPYERGNEIAAYLETASPDALADLALCEVACATLPELREVMPAIEMRFAGEPMAVLIELEAKAARALVEKVPPLPRSRHRPRAGEKAGTGVDDLRRWAESIAEELHVAIAGDQGILERRASRARSHLATADRERLDALVRNGERWSAQDVGLCPAWAMFAATNEDAREGCVSELAMLSRSDLVQHSPRGARWARPAGGCGGVELQDPREVLYSPGPCGTGFLPAESRRFLWLYAKSER